MIDDINDRKQKSMVCIPYDDDDDDDSDDGYDDDSDDDDDAGDDDDDDDDDSDYGYDDGGGRHDYFIDDDDDNLTDDYNFHFTKVLRNIYASETHHLRSIEQLYNGINDKVSSFTSHLNSVVMDKEERYCSWY